MYILNKAHCHVGHTPGREPRGQQARDFPPLVTFSHAPSKYYCAVWPIKAPLRAVVGRSAPPEGTWIITMAVRRKQGAPASENSEVKEESSADASSSAGTALPEDKRMSRPDQPWVDICIFSLGVQQGISLSLSGATSNVSLSSLQGVDFIIIEVYSTIASYYW